ncbi:carboxypeptidase-like regulatory domain-containing protein [Niabella sp. W65]|nr:carboxypeptidase-like regulatory domain-containing protein [Niabella sp. W65]MCH7363474.1 carboxypeptidase-like regulatory domain-containing protein [Niabella sp. W65]ULT39394.1 carboxypeptidase-like regulatory domain-containing protein [Niabella sp. I65]
MIQTYRRCKRTGYLFSAIMVTTLVFLGLSAIAQQSQISGRVTDDKGTALPSVTVAVKGKGISTKTNEEGGFTIAARNNDVLVVSAVSYLTQEVTVTSATSYEIVLATNAVAMSDVVVVGYGKIPSERFPALLLLLNLKT